METPSLRSMLTTRPLTCRRTFASVLIPALSLALAACRGASFTGTNDGSDGDSGQNVLPTAAGSASGGTGPGTGPLPGATPSGLQAQDGKPCVDGLVDINFMFLIDTTGSMSAQAQAASAGITTLMDRIETLRQQLGGKLREARMGFIGYIDQARNKSGVGTLILPPTKDLAAARNYITAHSSAGSDNSDTSEGGGWAFATALDLMKKSATDATGAINVAFLLTDAWSHDGTPQNPECTSSPADCSGPRSFNHQPWEALMADPYFKALLIFDWSPNRESGNGRGDFTDGSPARLGTPMGQWAFVRKRWGELHTLPNAAAGAHLGEVLQNGAASIGQAMTLIASQVKPCAK